MVQFGISGRVETGRDTIPGAFTVTWIEVDPEHQMPLVDAATAIVMEQHGNEHYLGTCFATIGPRNYTFTAWTSPEAAQEALRGAAHTSAMKLAQTGDRRHARVTSADAPLRGARPAPSPTSPSSAVRLE